MTKIAFLNDTSKSMRLDFRFRRVSVCQRARGAKRLYFYYSRYGYFRNVRMHAGGL